jgi:uncharacterized delta-60 repeat protein
MHPDHLRLPPTRRAGSAIGSVRAPRVVMRRLLPLVAALLAGHLATAGHANAVAGDLDPRFGDGGKVITDFAGSYDLANALVIQADGKLVAGGTAARESGAVRDFGLARYKANGRLDAGFGIGGKVTTDFFGDSDEVQALVAQADGKIVAAGAAFTGGGSNPDFALARYNRDGSLDTTFGTGGKVTTNFVSHDEATALVPQADGKLVAAGFATDSFGSQSDFVLARYNPDGSLDTTFGTGGKVITDFGSNADEAQALVVQADGKLVAAGSLATDTYDFALARYNADGSLDTTFGAGGKVITDFDSGVDRANALAVQADGKLVAGGSTQTQFAAGFAMARYNIDGALDAGFGAGGKVTTDLGDSEGVRALLVQGGKLVAAGSSNGDFVIARYNPDGALDASFGAGGYVTTDFAGSADWANALAVQADGKLVAAGSAITEPFLGITDFVLARYRAS